MRHQNDECVRPRFSNALQRQLTGHVEIDKQTSETLLSPFYFICGNTNQRCTYLDSELQCCFVPVFFRSDLEPSPYHLLTIPYEQLCARVLLHSPRDGSCDEMNMLDFHRQCVSVMLNFDGPA